MQGCPSLIVFFGTITVLTCLHNHGNGTDIYNPIIVIFDPYVSILDKGNRYRYAVSDQLPFAALVATQFSRCLIELDQEDLEEGSMTSRSQSALAIAEHNSAGTQSITSSLEVWLAYKRDVGNSQVLSLQAVSSRLQNIASAANTKFNGTVTTILLPHSLVIDLPQNNSDLQILASRYQWGIILDGLVCTYSKSDRLFLQNFHPNVIVGSYIDFHGKVELTTALNRSNAECQSEHEKKFISTGTLYTAPDTFVHNTVNVSRLVETWHRLTNLSNSMGYTIILSKAFDTPYEEKLYRKSCGWWRLVENPKYISTKDYVFQEKARIANQIDLEESAINLTWLEKETNFSRENVGVILSPETLYEVHELVIIMNKISDMFSKVMLLIDDESELKYHRSVLAEFKNLTEISIMFMPHVHVRNYISKPIDWLSNNDDVVTQYVIPFIGNETMSLVDYVRTSVRSTNRSASFRIGLAFDISVCTLNDYNMLPKEIAGENDNAVQEIVFYFEEDEETVNLGANRMCEQRIALLEQCRNFINLQAVTKTRPQFVMLHYASYSEFYSNPLAMQNFVRYWKVLSDWARSSGSTIIFSNAVDGTRKFQSDQLTVLELGWWKRHISDGGKMNIWIDKRQETLRVAKQRLPGAEIKAKSKPSSSSTPSPQVPPDFGTEKILLIVLLSSSIAVLVVILGVYLIRRHYRESYMNKSELNGFFNGDTSLKDTVEMNGPHKVPYDKSRFEIDASAFSVDLDAKLGSGEFGLVCRGKLDSNQHGKVGVAVKMVNPEKFRKTSLNGLLSEIKVLAHVGKHENITELLGANTSELKHGKLFIFLELCLLGSLEKYLRSLRPTTQENHDIILKSNSEGRRDNRYINTSKLDTRTVLDPSLSQDLYRWSREVCNGMAYLATKHVVHADLSTRNVLLTLNKEAKICDFGLSRRMYNYANYVKQQQEPLPWKWMSPESLRLNHFSEKSDVWAYGVTLWEIYSLGDTPYPGLSWDANFPQMLQLGFRLSEPRYIEGNMFSIMKGCWNTDPDKRPTFGDLLANYNQE